MSVLSNYQSLTPLSDEAEYTYRNNQSCQFTSDRFANRQDCSPSTSQKGAG